MPFGYIYKITNKINDKAYIGQTTKSIHERWLYHNRKNSRRSTPISNALLKYGRESFIVEKLDEADSSEDLDFKEKLYIQKYNTLSPNGYNLELGGNKYKKQHKDTIAKRSKTLTRLKIIGIEISTGRRVEFLGLKKAEEFTGVDFRNVHSLCTGKKGLKSAKGWAFFFKGEEPENFVYSIKSNPKKVQGVNLKTGKVIKFDSLKKSETEGGFMRKEVSLCCRGFRDSYNGYKWSFIQ
jgi:group I intron endonuclease